MIHLYRTEINDSYRTIAVREKQIRYEDVNYCIPAKIVEMMNAVFRMDRLAEEYCYLLCMDAKCRLLGVFEIGHGTVSLAIVSSRDVFMKALMLGSVGIILVHNHPSGDATPSEKDMLLCRKINEASKLLDIELYDFIIVGRNQHISFNEEKMIGEKNE